MNYQAILLVLPFMLFMSSASTFAETVSEPVSKPNSKTVSKQQVAKKSVPARSLAKFPQPRRRYLVTIPTQGSRKAKTVSRLKVSLKSDKKGESVPSKSANKSSKKRQHYRQQIAKIARKYRLDPVLIQAVISVESAFNPNALSHKGAMGLMQLMPATARRFGAANPYDPVINIDAGSRYLSWLLKEFGDVRLALAAYNAGEGAVMRYGRTIPPYRETQRYVVKVLDHYDRYSSRYLIE